MTIDGTEKGRVTITLPKKIESHNCHGSYSHRERSKRSELLVVKTFVSHSPESAWRIKNERNTRCNHPKSPEKDEAVDGVKAVELKGMLLNTPSIFS